MLLVLARKTGHRPSRVLFPKLLPGGFFFFLTPQWASSDPSKVGFCAGRSFKLCWLRWGAGRVRVPPAQVLVHGVHADHGPALVRPVFDQFLPGSQHTRKSVPPQISPKGDSSSPPHSNFLTNVFGPPLPSSFAI